MKRHHTRWLRQEPCRGSDAPTRTATTEHEDDELTATQRRVADLKAAVADLAAREDAMGDPGHTDAPQAPAEPKTPDGATTRPTADDTAQQHLAEVMRLIGEAWPDGGVDDLLGLVESVTAQADRHTAANVAGLVDTLVALKASFGSMNPRDVARWTTAARHRRPNQAG